MKKGIEVNLKELRALKGWSQTELAKQASATGEGVVKQSTISAIEAGTSEGFSPQTMKLLADALGVTVLEIDEFAAKIKREGPTDTYTFRGKLDKILPPIGVFPRLLMQDGVTLYGELVPQQMIFLINPNEAAQLRKLPAGTDLEVDAPGIGSPVIGIKSYSVRVVSAQHPAPPDSNEDDSDDQII